MGVGSSLGTIVLAACHMPHVHLHVLRVEQGFNYSEGAGPLQCKPQMRNR